METERPQDQVALFIDFENIRYSVLNTFGREVGGQMLMEKARQYGLVTVSRAYADFSEHPDRVQRDLQVSGITAINVAAHQVGDRKKSGADMEMLMDIFETLLDRPFVKTFVLMTGDRHFIRAVTIARNRYGKTVVISGVPGSVSNDLIESAGSNFDPLTFEPVNDTERFTSFVRFVDRLERSKPFVTFKYISAAMSTSSEFPGMQEEESRQIVADAIRDGILLKEQRADGYRICRLNRQHQGVKDVLAGRPASLGFNPAAEPATPEPVVYAPRGGSARAVAGPVTTGSDWEQRARALGLPDTTEEEEAFYSRSPESISPVQQ